MRVSRSVAVGGTHPPGVDDDQLNQDIAPRPATIRSRRWVAKCYESRPETARRTAEDIREPFTGAGSGISLVADIHFSGRRMKRET